MTRAQTSPSKVRGPLTLLALVIALAAGCSDGELTYVCSEGDCGPGPRDAGDDLGPSPDEPDTDDPPLIDVPPEPGGFGDPCETDDDCRDRFCIVGLEGTHICTVRCAQTCEAEGYTCQLIEASGADLVRICYPEIVDLCKPCEQDFECGGLADRCVQVQDGTFCGSDCALDGVCPVTYDCRTFGEARQCVPEDNICSNCFDQDSDGFGEGEGCLGTDCNDLDPFVFQDAPELCDFKDNDCDNEIDEDFDTTSDPQHCGGCNQPCTLPHAVNICVASTCFIGECHKGFYDLDPAEPGCEYECVDEDPDIDDVPDREFRDTNCDGIDGDASQSIFVSASAGRPDGDGSFEDPVNTIWAGIGLAEASGLTDVLVAQGTYTGPSDGSSGFEPLELVEGIHVFGGYDAVTWERSFDNVTIISGNPIGILAENISDETIVAAVTVQAENGGVLPSGEGESSIALLGINADGLVVLDSVLEAGAGGEGDDGDPGRDGDDGGDGGVGETGNVDSNWPCGSSDRPEGGSVGTSTCAPGGIGGRPGHGTGKGLVGGSAGPVLGGPGGDGSTETLSWPTGDGADPGSPGCTVPRGADQTYCTTLPSPSDGANGAGGSGFGTVDSSGVWHPGGGGNGDPGDDGYGGGGGGGGGGATGGCGEFAGNCDGYGGAGGGGGGAGCGGGGGVGAQGGGGSFGIYLIDSSPTVSGTDITAGNGGDGGDGGRGGSGGFGGDGGSGGGTSCSYGGSGGRGGNGTDGGSGGHSGGGGGGVSFAIFLVDSSDSGFADDNVALWGTGGPGGRGPGNPGTRGEAGAVRRVTRD